MKDINVLIKIRAMELRQKHQTMDLATIEAILNDGAKIASERCSEKIKESRAILSKLRITGNQPN